jgi:hypothetical protein
VRLACPMCVISRCLAGLPPSTPAGVSDQVWLLPDPAPLRSADCHQR